MDQVILVHNLGLVLCDATVRYYYTVVIDGTFCEGKYNSAEEMSLFWMSVFRVKLTFSFKNIYI